MREDQADEIITLLTFIVERLGGFVGYRDGHITVMPKENHDTK